MGWSMSQFTGAFQFAKRCVTKWMGQTASAVIPSVLKYDDSQSLQVREFSDLFAEFETLLIAQDPRDYVQESKTAGKCEVKTCCRAARRPTSDNRGRFSTAARFVK